MPRYRRRRRTYSLSRPVKVAKYSNETFAGMASYTFNETLPTGWILFTKRTDILGTRKAKNFTLSLVTDSLIPFVFALVFVPEGTSPLDLHQGTEVESNYLITTSLYDPNQNVIMTGVFGGPNSTVERFKTRLARNLNSGDQIVLVVKALTTGEGTSVINAVLNYAISY